jgi:hypothetical protein
MGGQFKIPDDWPPVRDEDTFRVNSFSISTEVTKGSSPVKTAAEKTLGHAERTAHARKNRLNR